MSIQTRRTDINICGHKLVTTVTIGKVASVFVAIGDSCSLSLALILFLIYFKSVLRWKTTGEFFLGMLKRQ